jgi:5'-nucleotidase
MNPDGIRTGIEATGRPGTATSEVTYAALFAVQPFGNVVTTVTMTGEMIKRLLEQQFDNPGPGQTRILQVSGGFSYRYRLLAPAGGHVDPRSIMIGGRRIEPEDRVRVAANDFLVAGGDGFTVFLEGSDQVGGEVDIDALAAYFEANSPIRPGPQDRVIRTD